MFTGIIEEIGRISSVQKGRKSSKLTIEGDVIFSDLAIGDSVSVNGVCLTVGSFEQNRFIADVMSETLSRSSLGKLGVGSYVNLERAMPACGRFGGHIVSGHIDGIGTISEIRSDDNAIWLTVDADQKILKYIVEKGSICIDGTSLTVVDVSENHFRVSVIPHTAKATTIADKKTGDLVNLENDMIAKYVEKLLGTPDQKPQSNITAEFLLKAGF